MLGEIRRAALSTQHSSFSHDAVTGSEQDLQGLNAEGRVLTVLASVHLRTQSHRLRPRESGIGPRFSTTCHILVNRLTFPESQRPTKQSVSVLDGSRSRPGNEHMRNGPRSEFFPMERVNASLRIYAQDWCA